MLRPDPSVLLVQALGPMEKMGAFFSTGEVFFLLTSPLMGDPMSLPMSFLFNLVKDVPKVTWKNKELPHSLPMIDDHAGKNVILQDLIPFLFQ